MTTSPPRRWWLVVLAVASALIVGGVWIVRGYEVQNHVPADTTPGTRRSGGGERAASPDPSPAPRRAPTPARIRIPRFAPAAVAGDAGAARAGAPPRLERGSGQPTDRRPGRVPGAGIQVAALKRAMAAARASAEACLERWPGVHPALHAGVMLAFNVDRDGLHEVWIEGLPEIPEGPLRCLSEGIYQQDWSGLTDDPIMMTDKVRTQQPDAGP